MASRREKARDLNFGEAPFVDPMSAATQSSPLTGSQRAQLASSHSASRLSTIAESSRSGNRSDIAHSGSDFDSSPYTYSDAGTDLDRAKLVQHSSFNPSANAWVPCTPANAKVSIVLSRFHNCLPTYQSFGSCHGLYLSAR
jgi:hypothetical protein